MTKRHTTRRKFEHQPGLRALPLVDSLLPRHGTFLCEDDASAPHLRADEYAVVDLFDHEPQNGELYLVQGRSFRRTRYIKQVRSDMVNITGPDAEPSLVWWLADLRGFRKTNEVAFGAIPIFGGLSDGPYTTEDLQPRLLGRVIGYAPKPLDGLIATELGYENEAAANAAFDPAEYLDVMLATGHKPAVSYGRYFEEMPQRVLTDDEDAAVLAQRHCRVVWRDGLTVGVAFTEAC